MRKRNSGIKINAVYVLLTFLMVSTLFLCSGQRASAESRGSFTMQVGKTRRLQSQGGSAPYTWSTGNASVAIVTPDSDNAVYGIVTGTGEGSTTITLHSWKVAVYWYGSVLEDFTETWTVTVTASGTTSSSGSSGTGSSSGTSGSTTSTSPTSISLNKTSVKVKVGSTVKLSYTLTPSTASSKVSFSSSNSSVASVGSSGKITAKKAGTATIT
ncbi:MAG: Ig-like domain-containing protein, partial [Lachnospiraceae bacterium]|nr:Ig-like domain-containing protein [Lachnospiraceae bacterium]